MVPFGSSQHPPGRRRHARSRPGENVDLYDGRLLGSARPGACARGPAGSSPPGRTVISPRMNLTGLLPAVLADPAAAEAVGLVPERGAVDVVGPLGVRAPLLAAMTGAHQVGAAPAAQ